jgi:regulator of replication initiation timing
MYPTGGYGNFLYYILTEYFKNTVKIKNCKFKFSESGNSHEAYKYTEPFLLGAHYKNLKDFTYTYQVYDQDSYNQIQKGQQFLVLGDTGNLMDSVRVLQKYFSNATFIRTYAETFDEKLILWANCMTKSYALHSNNLYKDSLHTAEGIAKFANKSVDEINDQDAVDCLADFFQKDFDVFGKYYASPVNNAINISLKSFFNSKTLLDTLYQLAKTLDTTVIKETQLKNTINEFIELQENFKLLIPDPASIVGRALTK